MAYSLLQYVEAQSLFGLITLPLKRWPQNFAFALSSMGTRRRRILYNCIVILEIFCFGIY